MVTPTASSAPSTSYTSLSSTFPFILSVHLALERQRILAKRELKQNNVNPQFREGMGGRGPRVMVLGPANSGKSTLVKGLVNLAVGSGMGWAPAVVGLDPGNVSFITSIIGSYKKKRLSTIN
jgi:polyribonucleotide 5'-hydroxyl-kinase